MLITPRTYRLSQTPDRGSGDDYKPEFHTLTGWHNSLGEYQRAAKMLLVHQAGNVRVGEVVRYTLTYTPSTDRILPSPAHLHVKIKNSSAVPLRAAYLHGPYTLYVACYPSTFDPNQKYEAHETEGIPEFEPNLKAGGSWNAKLTIPENIRESAGRGNVPKTSGGQADSVTWIIEIASQVIFSNSAAVHFELLVGRDEKSVDLGFAAIAGTGQGIPGQLHDHQQKKRHVHEHNAQPRGIYSKAVDLVVDDTWSLWTTPALPSWDEETKGRQHQNEYPDPGDQDALYPNTGEAKDDQGHAGGKTKRKRMRVHLVILTHGLHSNLGADMLYLKESIDVAAKRAREDAKKRRAKLKEERKHEHGSRQARIMEQQRSKTMPEPSLHPSNSDEPPADEESDDDEQVIVRGFSGNAVRTERGIQYLGKRLAKYVLSLTYPDQPFLPVKSSIAKSIARSLTGPKPAEDSNGPPVHAHSSIHRDDSKREDRAFQITSISFIAHSLGGLIQTYAIAYIQKHSPQFFEIIKPINFVAMASPFLGLSNENPIYVKFALDFGLVGRTGQDLGLSWRTPTMVRSGWGAMIGGLGSEGQKASRQANPSSKPLLRILPSGPAYPVLKKFRNRTVYSNVVNDGIVPLRTSCLLFLDWRGLGRVEKARRQNGLVGTMAGWGWAEITGANSGSPRPGRTWNDAIFSDSGEDSEDGKNAPTRTGNRDSVPQPDESATNEDNAGEPMEDPKLAQAVNGKPFQDEAYDRAKAKESSSDQPTHPWNSFMSLFKSNEPKPHHHPDKHAKIYKRSQTVRANAEEDLAEASKTRSKPPPTQRLARGDSLYQDEDMQAPPKTTFLESARDVLSPPLPPTEYLIDPSSRPRTIFHDRVYQPEDIPLPPAARPRITLRRSISNASVTRTGAESSDAQPPNPTDATLTGEMKIEEKIARAYHRELSWRKVLVRLEPDAHNNMVVRRMFTNAYGWPVIKHLVDTHFAYTLAAQTEDSREENVERAKPMQVAANERGEEVEGQVKEPPTPVAEPERTYSEVIESRDEVPGLVSPVATESAMSSYTSPGGKSRLSRQESGRWSDQYFEGSDDDSDGGMVESPTALTRGGRYGGNGAETPTGTSEAEIADFLSASPSKEVNGLKESPMERKEGRQKDEETEHVELNSTAEDDAPGSMMIGLTGIGLGKSVDEQLHGKGDEAPRRPGLSKQVAMLSYSKGNEPGT